MVFLRLKPGPDVYRRMNSKSWGGRGKEYCTDSGNNMCKGPEIRRV